MNSGYRRMYYEIGNGIIIAEIAFDGGFMPQTIEQDVIKFKALSERNRETFDVLELPFGAYAQDFRECNGYKVNVETKTIEFSYPVPGEPDAPTVHQKPLSESVSENTDYLLDVDFRLIMMELGM